MGEFFSKLFDVSDFPARWYCGTWESFHGWLHIVSDVAVFLAYMAIPIVIYLFARRRKNVQFPMLFTLFCGFIFACGTVHLIEAVIFWFPIYRISAIVKLTTAVVSWATVIALVGVLPEALKLPSLKALNQKLESETVALRQTKAQLSETLEELKKSKKMTDAIIETIGVAVVVINERGELVLENAASRKLTERVDGVPSATSWTNYCDLRQKDGSSFEATEHPLMLAYKGQKIDVATMMIGRPDESKPIFVQVKATPLHHSDGNSFGCVVTLDDVTTHLEQNSILREQQQETQSELNLTSTRLKQVLDSVEDIIWSAEILDGELKFVYFSPAFESVLGRVSSEFLGTVASWKAIIHPEDSGRISRKIKSVIDGETDSLLEEYRVIAGDGSQVWIRNRLRVEPGAHRVHGVISDITRQKKTQEVLVKAERLASLGTFSAGIAHEINNPLGAMMLTTEVVCQKIKRGSEPKEVLEYLEQTKGQIERCAKIVKNVLKFARNESSVKEKCSVVEIAKRARDLIMFKAQKKDVTISIEDDEGEGNAFVNSTEVEQVFINLFSNAVEASPEKSDVKVVVECSADFVTASVHDSGEGLDENIRHRAFDPFFTSRREQGGTGLGLSMCHTIISDHGGVIEIYDSTARSGAEVRFQIPIEQVAQKQEV